MTGGGLSVMLEIVGRVYWGGLELGVEAVPETLDIEEWGFENWGWLEYWLVYDSGVGAGGDVLFDGVDWAVVAAAGHLTGGWIGPKAFFSRTWMAFSTPNADFAMEFRSPMTWNLSIPHSKCWSESSKSSRFSYGCRM